jgi:hypothetical protein
MNFPKHVCSCGKCNDENEQFPVRFETNQVRIFTNPSNEIFIKHKDSQVQIRLSWNDGAFIFTTDSNVKPVITNGMIGYKIGRF